MTLLNRVAFVSNNLMSAYSLGILFAPHILCGRHFPADKLHDVFPKVSDLVTLMIENSSQMFNMPGFSDDESGLVWKMIELVCLLSLGFMSNNLQSGERNISGVGLFSGISSQF
jgi:hypothetical protein